MTHFLPFLIKPIPGTGYFTGKLAPPGLMVNGYKSLIATEKWSNILTPGIARSVKKGIRPTRSKIRGRLPYQIQIWKSLYFINFLSTFK